jgi:two-component system, LuxR family, sensor kinase FixL
MAVDQEKLWTDHNAHFGVLASIVGSPQLGVVVGFIAFEISYLLAFRFAISFGPESYSPLWLPASVLLCALLRSRPERWWLFILGILPIRILGQQNPDFPLWLSIANIAIDIAKGVGAAIALRHWMRNPLRLETLHDFAIFVLVAVLLVPSLAAVAGASLRTELSDEFWSVWVRWFISDALTQLVVTIPILYWVFAAPSIPKTFDVKRLTEPALLAGGLVLAGYWCMAGGSTTSFAEPRFYAAFPLMFWAGLRFGMAGASGAVAITAVFIVCALQLDGPFSAMSPNEAASAMQNFLFVRSAPLYVIAALMEQRNAVERTLQESERRFRSVADSAPMLLWMTDADKRAIFVNLGWLKFTGRTVEQELGEGWLDSVHPHDREHLLETWYGAFDARGPVEVEYRLRRSDGEYRWVLDRGTARLAEDGAFLGYVGSVLDFTDRKTTEDRNRALAHVQRLAIMGELTAAVAHELRQPSAAIMSNAEAALVLLESGEVPSDALREIVTDIKHANLRANKVLGQIQDFLRKRETEMKAIDMNIIVSDVLLLVTGDVRKRRMKIRAELGEDLPLILGNRTQLQQVLMNLIVNGMDAMSNTPDGKRHLVIQTSKANGDGRVEVAVSDSGSGIASGNMPRLFESFFTTREEGMGLGLSIARSIVESHGGRIWAGNNPEGGATFHFTVRTASSQLSIPSESKLQQYPHAV